MKQWQRLLIKSKELNEMYASNNLFGKNELNQHSIITIILNLTLIIKDRNFLFFN